MSGAAAREDRSLPAFFRRHDFDLLDSTNDEAGRRARNQAPEGTLVVARRQSGGRGRRGRAWQSPEGNLYCSLLLRPACSPSEAAQLSFVAAVALAEALSSWLPEARIGLKWPNDVLVDGAKIAGILLEAETSAKADRAWVVVGIGVNVESSPTDLDQAASALSEVTAASPTPEAVLATLAPALLAWYDRWRREGFGPVRAAWLGRAAFIGERIRAQLGEATLDGVFEALDADGTLLLRLEDGTAKEIGAGEIFAAPAG